MSNHLHVILRNRPDVVAVWSDEEVAIRWLRVFPGRRLEEHLAEPTEKDVETLVNLARAAGAGSQATSAVRGETPSSSAACGIRTLLWKATRKSLQLFTSLSDQVDRDVLGIFGMMELRVSGRYTLSHG